MGIELFYCITIAKSGNQSLTSTVPLAFFKLLSNGGWATINFFALTWFVFPKYQSAGGINT